MTVDTTQPSGEAEATGTEPVAEGTTEETQQTPRTVEEVEAEWRNRMSGKDRAHAAEVQTLTQRLSAFEQAEAQRRQQEEAARQANMTAEQRREDQINSLKAQLEEQGKQHTVEVRRIRFPNIAAELDDAALAVMDEGKLAALETKLGGQMAAPPSPTSLIDPNSVTRQNGTQPASREKTTDELKADLVRLSPAFLEDIRSQS